MLKSKRPYQRSGSDQQLVVFGRSLSSPEKSEWLSSLKPAVKLVWYFKKLVYSVSLFTFWQGRNRRSSKFYPSKLFSTACQKLIYYSPWSYAIPRIMYIRFNSKLPYLLHRIKNHNNEAANQKLFVETFGHLYEIY